MFTIEAENIQNSSIFIYDKLNRTIDIPCKKLKDKIEYNASFLAKGLYLIQIEQGETVITKKVIIH